MSSVENYFMSPNAKVKKALELLEVNTGKIILVVDGINTLLGTITDGDVRRALLNSYTVESPISDIMNKSPLVASQDEDQTTLFSMMKTNRISNIPIVNTKNQVVGLSNMSDIITPERKDNWVVIMAGGIGSRLRPLTNSTPKPMLPINGSPVLEILIKTFISQGFHKFYVSVNYLAEQVKEHFGDGEKYGIEIRYLEETEPLGTAGALSLLQHTPKAPFIVINGDIVTNVSFPEMFDFHENSDAHITMGVREHCVKIPYGVVNLDGHKVCDFVEKPTEKYYVNTGIYIVDPSVLTQVPKETIFTMPDLMEKVQDNKQDVQAFPVTEYWLDIGRMEDFVKAENIVDKISFTQNKNYN